MYGLVNVGAFSAIATTFGEKKVGFWVAFLVPTIIYLPIPFLLIIFRNRFTRAPPNGSELKNFFKIIILSVKRNTGKLWAKRF